MIRSFGPMLLAAPRLLLRSGAGGKFRPCFAGAFRAANMGWMAAMSICLPVSEARRQRLRLARRPRAHRPARQAAIGRACGACPAVRSSPARRQRRRRRASLPKRRGSRPRSPSSSISSTSSARPQDGGLAFHYAVACYTGHWISGEPAAASDAQGGALCRTFRARCARQ